MDRVDLKATNFTNWLPGEPGNTFGNEDCVEMYGRWAPGKWNDNHCSALRNYICEKKGGMTSTLSKSFFQVENKNTRLKY